MNDYIDVEKWGLSQAKAASPDVERKLAEIDRVASAIYAQFVKDVERVLAEGKAAVASHPPGVRLAALMALTMMGFGISAAQERASQDLTRFMPEMK